MARPLKSGELRINDIIFNVPPQSIQIIKRDNNTAIPTLRSTSSTKVKTGQKEVVIVVDLIFATGYNYAAEQQQTLLSHMNSQLAPLIIQTRKNPFCSIENEKIRTEMAGTLDDLENLPKNMAACIKSIRITSDLSSPELLRVQLVLKWFNYSPYTPDFKYLGDSKFLSLQSDSSLNLNSLLSPRSEPTRKTVDSPEDSHYYKLFYTEGTMRNGKFVNEVPYLSNDIELIYKEYREAGDADSALDSSWVKIGTNPLVERDIFYKYKSFKLTSEDEEESGKIVPVAIEFMLETRVPALPLIGQTIPTLQFLGVADATINISLVANAEIEGEKPVSTSLKLGKLDKVLERVRQNSIRFRHVSRRDPIYIKHPLLNLLQYGIFDTDRITYHTEDDQIKVLDPVESLAIPCIVNAVDSQTVEGLPFVNKVDLQLIESYKKTTSSTRLENQGLGVNIFDSLIQGLKRFAQEERIAYDSVFRRFISGFTAPGVIPDWRKKKNGNISLLQLTNGLVNLLNDISRSRYLSPNPDTNAILDFAVNVPDMQYKDEIRALTNRLASYVIEEEPVYLKSLLEELTTVNLVTQKSTYPDMKLPVDPSGNPAGANPDFYWNNESDITFRETQELGFKSAQEYFSTNYTNNIKSTSDQAFVETIHPDFIAGQKSPLTSDNTIKDEIKTEVTNSKRAAHDFTIAGQSLTLAASIKSMKDKTYTMRRAMPTFKLYFLQDNGPVDKTDSRSVWNNFEDFYDISAVKEIRLIKSKHMAADTLVVTLANVERDLVNADFPQSKKDSKFGYGVIDGELITQVQEFPRKRKSFDNIMLNEGTKIQLRLGTESDPNHLNIEFNGRITQIEGSDLLTLVCQSHGIELEQELKGTEEDGDTYTYNFQTNDIVSKLLWTSPEILNFGDRGINNFFGELEFAGRFLTGPIGGMSLADNLFAPVLDYSTGGTLLDKFAFGAAAGATLGTPVFGLGAIVGGTVGGLVGLTVGAVESIKSEIWKVPFTVYNQSVWEVIKELELRHPDCIASIVPYDTRMTLFFGYPEQLYFHRGPHFADAFSQDALLGQRFTRRKDFDKISETSKLDPSKFSDISSNDIPSSDLKELNKLLEYMKPFRSYHFVTSEHDIIRNDIRADYKDTYNAVKIYYPEEGADANLDGSIGFENYTETRQIKADDDIHANFIRTGTFVQHNARKWGNVDLPTRYGISILKKSLEKLYKGELVILGRENIKPYDVVFIYDQYSDIYGAVEVEQVVQTLSYETGWTTEIIPNMLIFSNNAAGRTNIQALQMVTGAQYAKNFSRYLEEKFTLEPVLPDEPLNKTAASLIKKAGTAASVGGTLKITKDTVRFVKDRLGPLGSKAVYNGRLLKTLGRASSILRGAALTTGVGLVVALLMDNAIEEIIDWSSLREPLVFLPLKRNGINWTLGLYGLNSDSLFESFSQDASQTFSDSKVAIGRAINKILGQDL